MHKVHPVFVWWCADVHNDDKPGVPGQWPDMSEHADSVLDPVPLPRLHAVRLMHMSLHTSIHTLNTRSSHVCAHIYTHLCQLFMHKCLTPVAFGRKNINVLHKCRNTHWNLYVHAYVCEYMCTNFPRIGTVLAARPVAVLVRPVSGRGRRSARCERVV